MSTDLRDALTERLDRVTPPPGDLVAVVREGRRIRNRRRAVAAGAVAAVLVVGGLAVTQLGPSDQRAGQGEVATDPVVGAADGLRAYADPGGDLRYGGLRVPTEQVPGFNADAAATPEGVVYYDDGRPMLRDLDGRATPLLDEPFESRAAFRPTAKADSTSSDVAVAVLRSGEPRLLVVDTATREVRDSINFFCDGCNVVIDAFDDGAVFVRYDGGTTVWDLDGNFTRPFAGPGTRIADVRNGVVLYDGAVPEPEPGVGQRDYTYVAGAIDSQLTHDGSHVLAWSSTLAPTGAGDPLRLAVTEEDRASHWTIDTDGSILVASYGSSGNVVHDCDPVTGACDEVEVLRVSGGDVLFAGNDM
jgi:hypothetical protein